MLLRGEGLRELRQATRRLAQARGFAVASILTLALGVATVSAIFSVVHAVLFRPLPYPEPERLVVIGEAEGGDEPSTAGFATLADWRARVRSFEALAAVSHWKPTLVADDGAETLVGQSVSADFFRVMGVRPALGREFDASEDRPQRNRVAILGHGLWRRRFGGDPSVVGRVIQLGDVPYTVVGVMPPEFESSLMHVDVLPPQIWRPLGYDVTQSWACRDCRHLRAFARLAPGVGVASARSELAAVQRQIVAEHPKFYSDAETRVMPFGKGLVGPARRPLLLLLGLVTLLLLIAWANLASLFLARAAERRRELALRMALGASRWRILRERLAESIVVSAAGGALGLVLGGLGAGALLAVAPPGVPRLAAAAPDGPVALAAFGLSVITSLVLAAATGGRAWRADALGSLENARGASGAPERRRWAGALIVTDVALSVVLMVGAGLLGRSLQRLLAVDAGFERRGLLTMEVSLWGRRYDGAAAVAFYDAALQRLRALPGVTSAAVVSQLPLGGNFDAWGIHAESRPSANPAEDPSADRYSISPGYFDAMRIPLRRGRAFTADDREKAPAVAIVNETLAARVWPGGDPLGQRIRVGGTDGPWRTVVGVAGDVRHTGLDAPRTLQVYLPMAQGGDSEVVVAVRTSTPPASLARAAREAIAAVDPAQPVSRVATMEEVVSASTAERRFISLLAAVFAGLAVLLAGVGVAGVVSRSVTDRTREIGIRVALGAVPAAVRRLVVSRVAVLALAGAALGTLGAVAFAPLLGHLLFGVAPADGPTLAGALAVVIAAPLVAAWLPARRAARLDPLEALRQE